MLKIRALPSILGSLCKLQEGAIHALSLGRAERSDLVCRFCSSEQTASNSIGYGG